MNEITTAFFAYENMVAELKAEKRKLEESYQPKITTLRAALLELASEMGRKAARFNDYDVICSPKGEKWVITWVTGFAAQMPNLEVKVISEYQCYRIRKDGTVGRTFEKFRGAALAGWKKTGTMTREEIWPAK